MIRANGFARLAIVVAILWAIIWGYAAWSGYEQMRFGRWITAQEMSRYYNENDIAIGRRHGPYSAEGFQEDLKFDSSYGVKYWKERASEGEDRMQLALCAGLLLPFVMAMAGIWVFKGFNLKVRS